MILCHLQFNHFYVWFYTIEKKLKLIKEGQMIKAKAMFCLF
jgi:hypothetical protein